MKATIKALKLFEVSAMLASRTPAQGTWGRLACSIIAECNALLQDYVTEPAVDEGGEDAGASAEWRADALDALEGSPGEACTWRLSRLNAGICRCRQYAGAAYSEGSARAAHPFAEVSPACDFC